MHCCCATSEAGRFAERCTGAARRVTKINVGTTIGTVSFTSNLSGVSNPHFLHIYADVSPVLREKYTYTLIKHTHKHRILMLLASPPLSFTTCNFN